MAVHANLRNELDSRRVQREIARAPRVAYAHEIDANRLELEPRPMEAPIVAMKDKPDPACFHRCESGGKSPDIGRDPRAADYGRQPRDTSLKREIHGA